MFLMTMLEVTRSNVRDALHKEYVETYFKLKAEFKSVFVKCIEKIGYLKLEIIWRDWKKSIVRRS